jgi:hypothetical protein
MLSLFLLPHGFTRAQSPDYQRIIHRSVADVQAFVQSLRPAASGRLPTLEGFVQQQDQPLQNFERGYYECTFQVVPAVGGGTMVQATARITAWYTDPMPARSGYRVLVSNGRLENDFLDRIEESLIPTGKSPSATAPRGSVAAPTAAAPSVPSTNADGLQPAERPKPAAISAGESSSLDSSLPGTAAGTPRLVPASPTVPLPAGESLESSRARRAANEKKADDLTAYVTNMEEILHNQARPADLVAVKSVKAPIFAKPLADSQVLLTAVTQDEFPLLGVEGVWAHVQISGPARGWIRRAQLEMPPGYAPAIGSADADPAGAAIFKVSKEETSPFTGAWEPLRGKIVRIDWVEPVSPSSPSSAKEKLAFAKSVFLHGYENLNAAHQSAEGIVIVFDSADGGQVASPMSSVKALAEGTVSESVFWRQCSLDPPESFRISAKP